MEWGHPGSTPIRDRNHRHHAGSKPLSRYPGALWDRHPSGIETPGTGRLGTTTFGIDTLRAVLWITGNSGIETPGNPGVGFEPYGSKPRSRVRTPSGSKPQESGSNPRDRNPRSRVRTLGIETHESGSNPIGIETQPPSAPQPLTAGSNPGHPSGIETHTDKNVWVSIPGGCTRPKTIALVAGSKPSQPKVRHPGVEPGPPRWQREIITARLMTLQDDTCRIRTYAGGTQ